MATPSYIGTHPDGVVLALRIQPRASRTEVVGPLADRLKVAVSGPPVDGKANRQLRAFLARRLGVPKSAVEILSGETSRDKSVLIVGVRTHDILAAIP